MIIFPKNKNNAGFTLVELLMAMAITTIVSAGIVGAYRSQQNTQLAQKQSVEMQQNIRAALYIMTSEIRMAGYDPEGTNGAGIVNAGDGSNSSNRLIFTYFNADAQNDGLDNNNDGNIDEPGENLQAVEYYLYDSLSDGTIDLGRRNGARLDAIADNIQTLQFTYLDADSNVTTTLSDIRSIQILIVATTDVNELNYTGTNNNRTLTTTVKCRNLGL
jgi:type IV pilus assembly protein PilW